MDLYHGWFNLKPGVRDTESCESLASYLDALQARGNQRVRDFRAALYRDFPDPHRKRGEEKF